MMLSVGWSHLQQWPLQSWWFKHTVKSSPWQHDWQEGINIYINTVNVSSESRPRPPGRSWWSGHAHIWTGRCNGLRETLNTLINVHVVRRFVSSVWTLWRMLSQLFALWFGNLVFLVFSSQTRLWPPAPIFRNIKLFLICLPVHETFLWSSATFLLHVGAADVSSDRWGSLRLQVSSLCWRLCVTHKDVSSSCALCEPQVKMQLAAHFAPYSLWNKELLRVSTPATDLTLNNVGFYVPFMSARLLFMRNKIMQCYNAGVRWAWAW